MTPSSQWHILRILVKIIVKKKHNTSLAQNHTTQYTHVHIHACKHTCISIRACMHTEGYLI